MPFSRNVILPTPATEDVLTAAMVGIGMALSSERSMADPNIEDTLLAASSEGMEQDDLRVLDLLVTWLGLHSPWVNADRLVRATTLVTSTRVRTFWAAVGHWLQKDRRFVRLRDLAGAERVDLLRTGSAFQVQRRGEDPRFAGSPLVVPAGILRGRASDVLSPSELAKKHRAYRCRVMMGPSYRADMWATLEQEPGLSAAEVARKAYGSFATAWQVRRDRALVEPAQSEDPPRRARRKRPGEVFTG